MIIASRTQFHVERPWGQRPFSVLNVKAVVAALNQEKAQIGAFSMIVNLLVDIRLKLYRCDRVCSGGARAVRPRPQGGEPGG